MRKLCLGLSFVVMAVLAACGGDSSSKAEESDTDEIVAESVDDLPNCTKKREGQKARTDDGNYVCTDGVWKAEAEEIPSYETEEDVPACTKKKEGTLVYVEDTEDTLICKSGEWKNVDDSGDGTTEDESSSSDEESDEKSSSSDQSQPECELTVATEDELPICTMKRDGITACIEDIGEVVVCESGMWSIMTYSSSSEEESSSSDESSSSSSDSGSGEMVSCEIPGVMGECIEYPVESDEAASLREYCESVLDGTLGTGCSIDHCEGVTYDESTEICDSRDGQVYRTITINIPAESYSEVWMAENLNFETANSYCYEDDPAYCETYGRLYTWAAAVAKPENECGPGYECNLGSGDVRGACPKGWHVPSQSEWNELITAVGGSSVAGTMLKTETGWQSHSGVENTDAFGFSALPAGFRSYDGSYDAAGDGANFWSYTEYDGNHAYTMTLYYPYNDAFVYSDLKSYGFSVRCLKD